MESSDEEEAVFKSKPKRIVLDSEEEDEKGQEEREEQEEPEEQEEESDIAVERALKPSGISVDSGVKSDNVDLYLSSSGDESDSGHFGVLVWWDIKISVCPW